MAKMLSLRSLSIPGRVLAGLTIVLLTLSTQIGCQRSEESVANTASPPPVTDVVGKRIDFKTGGNSEPFRISGWSTTETEFTWTEGTVAISAFPISQSPGGLTLYMVMAALIKPPELPMQPVEVYANGQKIAEWEVGNTAEFDAAIPGSITRFGGTLTIEFRTPKAASPKALGLNPDPRVLGICVRSLELMRK